MNKSQPWGCKIEKKKNNYIFNKVIINILKPGNVRFNIGAHFLEKFGKQKTANVRIFFLLFKKTQNFEKNLRKNYFISNLRLNNLISIKKWLSVDEICKGDKKMTEK